MTSNIACTEERGRATDLLEMMSPSKEATWDCRMTSTTGFGTLTHWAQIFMPSDREVTSTTTNSKTKWIGVHCGQPSLGSHRCFHLRPNQQ